MGGEGSVHFFLLFASFMNNRLMLHACNLLAFPREIRLSRSRIQLGMPGRRTLNQLQNERTGASP